MNKLANTFTVDVEDYFHVSAFAARIQPREWPQFESRVVANTHRMLRLLTARETLATFFVLGWVADRFPSLVSDIRADGHEIGSHGYWHRLVYNQSEQEFREDIRRSCEAIDHAAGVRPVAYRAPSFSITERSAWALDILVEEGFQVDSSIFPIHHDRYGIPTLNPAPHKSPLGRAGLWEVPPSVVSIGGVRIPVAGGGYFRLFPEQLTRLLQKRLVTRHARPLVFYIHPWEIDPEQPRLPAGPLTRIRHYRNLHATEERLDRMLHRESFGTMAELVAMLERDSATAAAQKEHHPKNCLASDFCQLSRGALSS